ncbi:O-antigen ligase family protein [bacterium]|nr:O-antigen ligase family protein [bacterium]
MVKVSHSTNWHTPTSVLSKILTDGFEALAERCRLDRALHIFWLLGPLFLLIERSPADIWLSLVVLSFLVRSVINRDYQWTAVFWVRAGFLFWAFALLSATLSALPVYSFSEALVWFRFPLFAVASCYWLGKDQRLARLMLLSVGVGVLVLCCIVAAELITEGQRHGRLYWPFGDPVVGNYLAKLGLPLFVSLLLACLYAPSRLAVLAGLIALVQISAVFLTGERSNFLILFCSFLVVAVVTRGKSLRTACFFAVFALVLATGALFKGTGFMERNTVGFLQDIPISAERGYFKTVYAGIEAWKTSPIIGIGPGNHRLLCDELLGENPNVRCDNHPHNFYVQLLEETGLVGLILGSLFLGSVFWKLFKLFRVASSNNIGNVAWVVPFALFWPITGSADFFGQWNNCFLWSAIGIALAMCGLSTASRE